MKAYLTVNFNDPDKTSVQDIPYRTHHEAIEEAKLYVKTPGVVTTILVLVP